MSFFSRLRKDIRVVFERDPAARSVLEVLFCYSGLHASGSIASRTSFTSEAGSSSRA